MKKRLERIFFVSCILSGCSIFTNSSDKITVHDMQELKNFKKINTETDEILLQKVEIKPQVFLEYTTVKPFFKNIDPLILKESLLNLHDEQPTRYRALSDLLIRSMDNQDSEVKIIEQQLLIELLSIVNSHLQEKFDDISQKLQAGQENNDSLKTAVAFAIISSATSVVLSYLYFGR